MPTREESKARLSHDYVTQHVKARLPHAYVTQHVAFVKAARDYFACVKTENGVAAAHAVTQDVIDLARHLAVAKATNAAPTVVDETKQKPNEELLFLMSQSFPELARTLRDTVRALLSKANTSQDAAHVADAIREAVNTEETVTKAFLPDLKENSDGA